MGSLGGGVWIAPHADREPLVAAALRAVGATDEAVSFRAGLGSLGRPEDLLAAWDLAQLAAEYAAFRERFGALRPRGGEGSFRAQTELVHAWRRLAFLDPDLPADLLPRDWPRRQAYELFQRRNAAWAAEAQAHFAELEAVR
jgi:phenylacetic acid degradation operon negative regulatory protein